MIELNLSAGRIEPGTRPGPWARLRQLLRAAAPAAADTARWAECRIDAAARAAWRDPVQFRREHLPPGSRARRVLDEVARRAGWAGGPPAGGAQGLAMAEVGGTWVGLVAEVSGAEVVRRLVVAVDAGPVIDLDEARQEVLAGLRIGLAAALPEVDTAAVRIDVGWVLGDTRGTDRAEAAEAAVAPALANAWSALRAARARERALAAAS